MGTTGWNQLTQGVQRNMVIYLVSKTLTKNALWKLTKEYGDLDPITSEYLLFHISIWVGLVLLMLWFFPKAGPLTLGFLEFTKPGNA
jgi:hypothetical protein